jgi:sugar lactone lactonase YvrE
VENRQTPEDYRMESHSSRYTANSTVSTAKGWTASRITPPSTLFGANGMRFGPDGRLYVAQAFGSQISAIDITSGAVATISPIGGPIVGPDDLVFDSRGILYITEVMSERVCARSPNGEKRLIAENVPGANGITAWHDRLFMDECRADGRLFELFPDGRAPRQIADKLPLPNALSVGPDGKIYFPAIGANEIWRVAPEGGKPEVFATGLAVPTAVKHDSKGFLLSTQGGSGEILRFDLQSGDRRVVAKMRPGIDNFALTGDDRLFVSHFVDGGVAEIMSDGTERRLVPPGFCGPMGIAIADDGTIYAADGISMAAVAPDGSHHRVGLLFDGEFPGFVRGVAKGANGLLIVTTTVGNVTSYHPVSHAMEVLATGLHELYDVAIGAGGNVLVADGGEGRVLEIAADTLKEKARGLARPTGLAVAPNGACFVAESDKGRVTQIDGGTSTAVIEGLKEPQGLAIDGDSLYVVDAGAHELIAYSLKTRQRETVASNLPVGSPPGVVPKILMGIPGLLPGPLRPFAGVTVGGNGRIYISADGDGSVLGLSRA